MNNAEYRRKRFEKMKENPEVIEAFRKKDRERKKRKALLDKIQRAKDFLIENGFTVEMK